MDYLDTAKEMRHRITILVGYVLIAVAIVLTALIMLYQTYGFGITKEGGVIQNGLTFFSSQPNPADIYVNGDRKSKQTNTRLVLPAGIYDITLAREGYRDWKRTIEVKGGNVHHYDYPFLVPKTLSSDRLQPLTAAPALQTQSPDRRWLLIQQGEFDQFILYNLEAPDKTPLTVDLPDSILSQATSGEQWQLVEWAGDNRRVLLQHVFDGKTEYILLDRDEPALSLNLNTTLAITPVKLTLNDKKYDKYYLHDPATGRLQTLTLREPTPVTRLEKVLAYQTYGDDTVLYATEAGAQAGKVNINISSGNTVTTVRSLPAGSGYILDFTKYDGVMYVAAGDVNGTRVYIYRDPVAQRQKLPDQIPVPSQVLHVEQPNHVSFSQNAQFIVAENGNRFGVYDIENETGYNFTTLEPLDAPQTKASWMDGNRLIYVSNGKLVMFDYDNNNHQTLVTHSGAYLPAFAPDYDFVYTLAPNSSAFELNQTSLLIPADQ
jgi:hypothetical protein